MPKAKNNIDNKTENSINPKSPADFDTSDSPDLSSSDSVAKATPDEPKTAQSRISDLKAKYPSRTLEDLRKIDFVNQYQSKFPKVERSGYVIAWICNTPDKNNIDLAHKAGYDLVDGIEPVPSGYSDFTGEDRYAHYCMQIPQEIYDKKKQAERELNDKMYGHILRPKKEGTKLSRSESGLYQPEGVTVQTINRVIQPNQL